MCSSDLWKDGPRLFSILPLPGKAWNPKSWTQLEIRVTIWCEASRWPVPLYRDRRGGEGEGGAFRGSETITLTREWVEGARTVLKWTSWIGLALVTAGPAGLAGLVSATGGVISPEEAKDFTAELGRQQKALKDLYSSLPDASPEHFRSAARQASPEPDNSFGAHGLRAFGVLAEGDLKLIRFLREEFKKKDPTWGGLKPRDDGKFGRIWAHAKAPVGE